MKIACYAGVIDEAIPLPIFLNISRKKSKNEISNKKN